MKRLIYYLTIIILIGCLVYTSQPLLSKSKGILFKKNELKDSILTQIPELSEIQVKKTNTIYLIQEKLSPSLLKVSVSCSNLKEKIIGLAFDLNFNPGNLEFIEYRKGNFFEKGGEPIYISQLAQNKSNIITGITLKRGDKLQNGSGDLIYFYFNVLKNEKATFGFKNTVISTLLDGERKDINSIFWEQ